MIMKSMVKTIFFLSFFVFSLSAFAEQAAHQIPSLTHIGAIVRCDFVRQTILLHIVQGFGLGMLLMCVIMLFTKINKIWVYSFIIISLICYFAPLHFTDQTTMLLITPDFIKHLFVKNVTLFG